MFGRKKAQTSAAQTRQPFLVAWRTEDGGMTVNIDPDGIESPGMGGIVLADLYRHFARALAQTGKAQSEEHAKADMNDLFLKEIQAPTDEGTGTVRQN